MLMKRRTVLAAAGTLAVVLPLRKSLAAELHGAEALVPTTPPKPVPALSFSTPDGATKTLADWKGQGVVFNLWATWCMPCVAEMPALAALEGKLAQAKTPIAVLPVSIDHGGADPVKKFFASHGIKDLPVLLDPKNTLPGILAVRGVPTTLIIGKDGLEHARAEGAVDWASDAVIARIRDLTG